MNMDELSDTEKQLLAREVAADRFHVGEDLIEYECEECSVRGDVEGVPVALIREAVKYGWDAAMTYIKEHGN